MKTTGIFKVLRYDIEYKQYNDHLDLWFSGDWHYDSPLCYKEKLEEFIDKVSADENCRIVLMGDYLDGCSTSERAVFKSSCLHDATHKNLDKAASDRVEELAHKLRHCKGRIIGVINGNHYWQYANGLTTDHHLAQLLETNFLGVCSYVRLTYRRDQRHSNVLDLFLHHGKGGGKRPGSSVNNVEDMRRIARADIYAMGHDHKRSATPFNFFTLSKATHLPTLENRRGYLVRSGSFLKGYEEGEESYIADMCGSPCDLGAVKITVTPRRKESKERGEKRWLDLEATL